MNVWPYLFDAAVMRCLLVVIHDLLLKKRKKKLNSIHLWLVAPKMTPSFKNLLIKALKENIDPRASQGLHCDDMSTGCSQFITQTLWATNVTI